MSLIDIALPEADIQRNAANVSYWTAVHNPVSWQLERKDDPVIQVIYSSSPGDPTSVIQISGITGEPVQGDYIYFKSGDGTISETFEILGVADILGNTIILIQLELSAAILGGHINYLSSRTNYFIEVEVSAYDENFDLEIISIMRLTPNNQGIAKVNLMEYLKIIMGYTDEFLHNEIMAIDYNLGRQYSIRFRESYSETVTDWVDTTLNALGSYITNSAKQLQDVYGENMGDFVPSILYTGAKFMNDFIIPTFVAGYPFSQTFILSRDITHHVATQLVKHEQYFNINGGLISGVAIDIYDANNEPNVARLMVEDFIPAGTVTITQNLRTNGGVVVTEVKTIKYHDTCEFKNPVYLNWLGTTGGRNYWLFSEVQSEVLEVEATGEFQSQTNDLETDLGLGNYTGKKAFPSIVCYGYLPKADLLSLEGLLKSPDVLMLTNIDTWKTDNLDTSPVSEKPIWKRVKLIPETYKILDTDQTHAEIEFTLRLPEIYIQNQ